MTPEIATGRVESAEYYIRAQVNVIELIAGRVCEKILFPDHEPLPTSHDLKEAIAFAGVACASNEAVAAMVSYAEAEAAALIREHLNVVSALVDAIIERRHPDRLSGRRSYHAGDGLGSARHGEAAAP
jgi:hypothetical protein